MSSSNTQTTKTARPIKSHWYGAGVFGLALLTTVGTNGWMIYWHGFRATAAQSIQRSSSELASLTERSPWTASLVLHEIHTLKPTDFYNAPMAAGLEKQLMQDDPLSVKPSQSFLQQSATVAQQTATLLLLSFWQWLLKILNILVSAQLMCLALLAGAADGLCQRHIRTAEGGRESTWLYHSATKPLQWCATLVTVLYCIVGVITPTVCVLVLSLLFFLIARVRTACLKKYL